MYSFNIIHYHQRVAKTFLFWSNYLGNVHRRVVIDRVTQYYSVSVLIERLLKTVIQWMEIFTEGKEHAIQYKYCHCLLPQSLLCSLTFSPVEVWILCRNGTPLPSSPHWHCAIPISACWKRCERRESMWERMGWKRQKVKEGKMRECDKDESKSGNKEERTKMSADSKWVVASCKGARLWDVKEWKREKQLEYKKTLKWESVTKQHSWERMRMACKNNPGWCTRQRTAKGKKRGIPITIQHQKYRR